MWEGSRIGPITLKGLVGGAHKMTCMFQTESRKWEFPDSPVVWFLLQDAQVQSLVRELRSPKLCGTARKTTTEKMTVDVFERSRAVCNIFINHSLLI